MKSFIKVEANVKVIAKADAKAKKTDSDNTEKNKKVEFYVNPDSITALVKAEKNFYKVIFKDKISGAIVHELGTEFSNPLIHKDDLK